MRLLSYNIRKGKGASGRAKNAFERICSILSERSTDILLFQEVFHHAGSPRGQAEMLGARVSMPHYYGPAYDRRRGRHGNAILTRYVAHRVENHDVSTNPIERRGLLYVCLDIDGSPLHVFNTHLGLSQRQRHRQVSAISRLIDERVQDGEPVVLAGDFNDWNHAIDRLITLELGFTNALSQNGDAGPTWHARRPLLNLDRIYVRNLSVSNAERLSGTPWTRLSDHLPLEVEFELSSPGVDSPPLPPYNADADDLGHYAATLEIGGCHDALIEDNEPAGPRAADS